MAIDVVGQVALKVAHEVVQVFMGRAYRQVEMVAHEEKEEDVDVVAFGGSGEPAEDEGVDLGGGGEKEALLEAAVGDEVAVVGVLDSERASHGGLGGLVRCEMRDVVGLLSCGVV